MRDYRMSQEISPQFMICCVWLWLDNRSRTKPYASYMGYDTSNGCIGSYNAGLDANDGFLNTTPSLRYGIRVLIGTRPQWNIGNPGQASQVESSVLKQSPLYDCITLVSELHRNEMSPFWWNFRCLGRFHFDDSRCNQWLKLPQMTFHL